jgi:hypothetical protein
VDAAIASAVTQTLTFQGTTENHCRECRALSDGLRHKKSGRLNSACTSNTPSIMVSLRNIFLIMLITVFNPDHDTHRHLHSTSVRFWRARASFEDSNSFLKRPAQQIDDETCSMPARIDGWIINSNLHADAAWRLDRGPHNC